MSNYEELTQTSITEHAAWRADVAEAEGLREAARSLGFTAPRRAEELRLAAHQYVLRGERHLNAYRIALQAKNAILDEIRVGSTVPWAVAPAPLPYDLDDEKIEAVPCDADDEMGDHAFLNLQIAYRDALQRCDPATSLADLVNAAIRYGRTL